MCTNISEMCSHVSRMGKWNSKFASVKLNWSGLKLLSEFLYPPSQNPNWKCYIDYLYKSNQYELIMWNVNKIKIIDHVKWYLAKTWTLPRMTYSCEVEIDTKLWFLQTLRNLISNFCSRWWGSLFPGLHTLDHLLDTPLTWAETFCHMCQQSHIQSYSPTRHKSYPKFRNPMTLVKNDI